MKGEAFALQVVLHALQVAPHVGESRVMADIVETWMWRDPEEIIERLLARSGRASMRPVITLAQEAARGARGGARDRYYTMARRCHVKQLMRGRG